MKNINKNKIFDYSKNQKVKIFTPLIVSKMKFHLQKNNNLKLFFKKINQITQKKSLENYPFMPVRLFKKFKLTSINDKDIYKIITSSGTSGDVSRIYLNKKNAKDQIEVLYNIGSSFLGKQRYPMIILDSKKTNQNKNDFNARRAAVIGFSIFSKKNYFIFDEDQNLKLEYLKKILSENKNKKIIIFGFTDIVWNFIQTLEKTKLKLNLSNCILLHGGGWKKLADKKITNDKFINKIKKNTSIKKIINYYGMIEQTGSIFFECEHRYFHTSIYSDILIRDKMLNIQKFGKEGIIQLLSIVPSSYPGNIILTEDMGTIFGEDDCICGRKGKYFRVSGRIPNAELRGCSNVNL